MKNTHRPRDAPIDIIFDIVLRLQGERDDPIPIANVAQQARPMGFTDLQVQEALENWVSLLVFRIDSAAGTVLALRDYIAALALELPSWAGGRTPEAGNAPTPPADVIPTIALLSLFDGSGLARLAVEELLRALGLANRLVQAGFAELQDDLAIAVQAYWQRRANLSRGVAYQRLARDVWDLLRGSPSPFEQFVLRLPQWCLVIIIAGSPCQQLSWAGRYQGRQGLCGPDSVLFSSFPFSSGQRTDYDPTSVYM